MNYTSDLSLTPFSIAFSWHGKLQFYNVTPYRLEHYNIYRVMKGHDCYAVFTLEDGVLRVPARYRNAAAIPKSLHLAIAAELKEMLAQQSARQQEKEAAFEALAGLPVYGGR